MAERVAGGPTVARWESWDGTGLQHLVLRVGPEEIVAVPSAPGAASVRVWQVMSRGRDPSTVTGPRPGGDSLAAMRIASQVLATWSLELSLAVILEAATVAQMAAAVRDRLAQPRT